MRDLQSHRLMWVKAILFLIIGVVSSGLIVMECPEWRTVLLLALAIWSFCRAYYFAFYVIEHYVDPSFRYAGLWAMVRYLWRRESVREKREGGRLNFTHFPRSASVVSTFRKG